MKSVLCLFCAPKGLTNINQVSLSSVISSTINSIKFTERLACARHCARRRRHKDE